MVGLADIGRAQPARAIQDFQLNQSRLANQEKTRAVTDLNMQRVKQDIDITGRKEKAEVDAISKEKANRERPFHLYSNPVFNKLSPGMKKIYEEGMISGGFVGEDGHGTMGAAMDFLNQAETTSAGIQTFIAPIQKEKQEQIQNLDLRIREEKLKDIPNPKVLESLTAQHSAMLQEWGAGEQALKQQMASVEAQEKQQSAIELENLKQEGRVDLENLKGEGVDKPTIDDFKTGFLQSAFEEELKTPGISEDVAKENALARLEDLEKKGSTQSLSNLGKLRLEKSQLPEDDIDGRAQFDKAIEKAIAETRISASFEQATTLAQLVIDGKLDPNKISKRGGLQQNVFSEIARLDPDANIVELEANARFKNLSPNLTSRALINGVEPLYDNLLKVGKELNNSNIQAVNKAINFAKEQTGDRTIVAFNNLRDDVIAETERILLGSGVLSDSKYLRAVQNVNSSQALPQLEAAIKQLRLVVKARLHALDKPPFKDASSVIDEPDPQKGTGPEVTATNQETGEVLVLRNGKWESQ